MISLTCPHCSRRIRAPERLAGRRVRCPACHQALTVPSAGLRPPGEPGQGAEARTATEAPVPVILEGKLAMCPACGRAVTAEAVLCTHCGTHLRTGRRQLTKVKTDMAAEAEAIRSWVEGVSLILWLAIVPYRSTAHGGRSRWATTALVLLTSVVSFAALIYIWRHASRLGPYDPGDAGRYAPYLPAQVGPYALWSGRNFEAAQLVTHLFLHGGLAHLIGNMIFLWAFGAAINAALGRLWYPVIYLALGAAAGYCGHVLPRGSGLDVPLVGASGAIAALSGMYLVLFPRHDIHMAAWFRLAWWTRPHIKAFAVPGIVAVLFYTAFDVAAMLLRFGGNVAHGVHLAGFAAGGVLALVLLLTGAVRSEGYDLLTWIVGDRWQGRVRPPDRR